MNLTAEQLQIASMIDAKMQELVCDGNDDLTILAAMFDYMPGFKRIRQRNAYSCPASPLRIGGAPDFAGSVGVRPGGRRQFGDPTDWKIT
jgi:hypothetical protein